MKQRSKRNNSLWRGHGLEVLQRGGHVREVPRGGAHENSQLPEVILAKAQKANNKVVKTTKQKTCRFLGLYTQ